MPRPAHSLPAPSLPVPSRPTGSRAAGILPALLVALSAGLALPAHAEPLSPVKTAELSARLYEAGIEMADPLLVVSAAKLRKGLGLKKGDLRAEGAGAAPEEKPLDWEEMLATAEEMSPGDEVIAGLADDVRAEGSKGVSSGPVYNIGSLGNGGTDTYPIVEFIGGEYAEVYVEAKSATDLNIQVLDAKGRLVCSDTDASHIAYCGWRPDATGGFVMKVQNNGPSSASYALMTN